MEMRLQKYMAECGVASRRKSEALIAEGKVKVNGITVTELGVKVDPQTDLVEVGGETIRQDCKKEYYMLNKPSGYVSSAKDQYGRPHVTELIDSPSRLYPVGRLDYDTEGLLIITNDGSLTYRLTHPKHNIKKEYEAKIRGRAGKKEIQMFRTGINIGDYITKPAEMEILSAGSDDSLVRITIYEGKNRQVRRMCEAAGHEVMHLKRTAVGDLRLEGLKLGEYRQLTKNEVAYLMGV